MSSDIDYAVLFLIEFVALMSILTLETTTTSLGTSENLGLGFCPFDTIYLLSAAVLDDSLYVMSIQCNKDEWKVANSDLKRVRSSFVFDEV